MASAICGMSTVTQKTPKVSVCVVTYNQNQYIRRCLQNIVDQETDFDFEVIVADDCSTDGTRAIVQEFADRYPKLMRPILNPKNLGPFQNYRHAHQAALGDYVAHIDGDDSACRGKLVKQKRYLDRHQDCVLVAHRMSIWDGSR